MTTYQEIVDTLHEALSTSEALRKWQTAAAYQIVVDVLGEFKMASPLDFNRTLSIPELAICAQTQITPEELNAIEQRGWAVCSPLRVIQERIIAHFVDVGNAYLAAREGSAAG